MTYAFHLQVSPHTTRKRKKRRTQRSMSPGCGTSSRERSVGQCEAKEGIEKRYKRHKNNRPKAMQEEVQDERQHFSEPIRDGNLAHRGDGGGRRPQRKSRDIEEADAGYSIVKGAPR